MATPVAEIEFIPDEALVSDPIDFIPDDAPAAEAVEFIPDEVVTEEAQRATAGALQAVDVMAAPGKLDWSEVNEKLDAERFREANALQADVAGKISTPERRATFAKAQELLSQISPTTTVGKYLAAQKAGQEQAAMEISATEERGSTPSSMLSGLVGPGLAPTVVPVVEGAARNAGAAAGGALAAAKFVPGPVGIAARLGPLLPIGAGIAGAIGGSYGQEALLQSTETPEETGQRQQRASEDFARNPGLSYLGAMAASAPWFRPGIAQFGRAAAGDKGAILNLGIAGGLGGAMEVGSALVRGDTVEARDVAMGIISNLLMNEPTRLGRKLGLKPSTEQMEAEVVARTEDVPQTIRLGGTEAGLAEAPVAEGDIFARVPRQPTTTEPNAQQISKTSPTDGGSLSQPEVTQGAAPVEEGGVRVQSSRPGEPLAEAAPAQARQVATDEQRIAKLVEAGMSPEDAAAGLARIKALEAPPAAAPEAAAPPVEPPTTPPTTEAPQPLDPTATSNKESVVNAERAARQLDPVIKEAAIENPNAIDYAERAIEANPARPQEIVDRLRQQSPRERSIALEDAAILLVERTKIRTTRDAALAWLSKANEGGNAMDKATARATFEAAENQLNAMDQAAQDARSTWGRFGQLWQRSMREDFSLANLERRARLSKDGPLTEKNLAGLTAIADKAKKAQDDFDIRQKQVELENRQNAIDSKIAEVSEKAKAIDPAVKSIADRIIARLDVAAKNAEKNLRQKLFNLGSAPDPTIILEVAKIAAARTAKATIEFAQWSAEMVSKFGEKVRPFLQAGWDQREQQIDSEIALGGGKKKAQVAARVKKTGTLSAAAQQARVEQAIGNRIAEGKPLSSLAPYVNKLQESFISQGITERDALIDAVHGALQKHDPAITRDDAMEIMSKYGADYATPLSKDPVKQTRRQVDGEIQQLLKLRDIAAGVPLPKSGPERPTPGATWRNLIKQVNAAKKKLGVVVTDPETQLKSSQDAIRTRLRNEIEDMTLELETGTRPPEKTPAEYTQDMEVLKAVRDRVRETLDSIEKKPGITDAQRLAMTKRAAEDSLAMWERRLAGEAAKQPKKGISTPEIEAIRAKRDAVRAEVEELNAADAVLQENLKAEALVRQIENVEAQLSGSANPRVRIQGADSQLVAEAREQLAALRNALDIKNSMDPQRQLEAIEKAEATLEASIKKLDAQLQAGDISTAPKRTGPQSERLDYLRAQRDAMVKLRSQMRAEARPRLSVDELAIKMRTTQMLKRAAELRQRMATGDFGPRTRKAPVDISGDRAALDAQADLMSVDAEFQKLQEQWKLDQLTGPEKVLRRIGQAWDATANVFLSFDLSTPLQTAFAMASHPIEGAKAIGKGATAFYQQFIKGSDAYAAREAARIANSINAKNGLYKAMKLELPSALGKKREENMASILENLADLDARWAGLPDVVKGLFKLEGKTLVKGGKRLASVAPAFVGRGIKASNAAFETIANTMRARTADAMLARWYGRGKGTPTKQQLELLGEQINIATGKGGLRAGDSIRRLLFAPNYYLSILKQLSGWQLGRALVKTEGQVAKDIATEYIRAVATMGSVYGLAMLFGDRDQMTFDPRDKSFARAKTDRGTSIDITMGRGSWITAAAQILTGERIDKRGRAAEANRKETALNFAGGRLSRGVATALTTAFGENYKGKPITGIEIAKDFVIPLSWRDFDDLLKREGMTRGSFIQLLNILGVTHKIAD